MHDSHQIKVHGIFERPPASFAFDPKAVGWILTDAANPLNQIARSISPGSTILDVGAGNGILPRLLKALGSDVHIDAIEPDPAARAVSQSLYRQVYPEALESFLECAFSRTQRYDFIILADVLEHLADPEPCLRYLCKLLSPYGKILLSVPNIAFASVRLALLNGHFDYVNSGIIERTHLRFYTRTTLLHLFDAAGLHPAAEYHCLRDPFSSEISLKSFTISPWLLRKIDLDKLSRVYQFLFFLGREPTEVTEFAELGIRGAGLPMKFLQDRTRRILAHTRQIFRA